MSDTLCSNCGNPTQGTDRCLADDLYYVLTSHGDFQSDHDGHDEFDCRIAVRELVEVHIDAAVKAALVAAAGRLREMAADRIDSHGPLDARGAAIWDAASWLRTPEAWEPRDCRVVAR